ncbi:MAG: hypothetical protein CMP20_09285 [Rickettsiales bacterium]|nr:hypothetical protein [Rickettsiales bacterium]
MLLDELPPEALHLLSYNGWLSFDDVLNLACSSEALFEKLTGDSYAIDNLRALLPIGFCVKRGWTRAVRFALKTQDPTMDNNHMFYLAIALGHRRMVCDMLAWRGPNKEFVDLTSPDSLALNTAFASGCSQIAKILLDWRGPNEEYIDATVQANVLLDTIAKTCSHDSMTILLAWRGPNGEWVDPTANDNKALKVATKHNCVEPVKDLLDWRGPNDEYVDPHVATNLIVRIRPNNASCRMLANVFFTWRGPTGEYIDLSTHARYMLCWTVHYNFVDILELLLDWEGPNGEWVDPTFMSNGAFQTAVNHNQVAAARVLLKWRGPNGKRINPDPESSLLCAVENRFTELVEILIEHPRIDPAINFNAPLECAKRNGYKEIVEILLAQPRVQKLDKALNRR